LPGSPDDPEIELAREQIRQALIVREAPEPCFRLLQRVPLSLLSRCQPELFAEQIQHAVERLAAGQSSICTSHYDPAMKATRYTVVHRESERSIGTFARSTGALSTQGLTIMRAQIEMIGGELAWDDFWVLDPRFPEQPPPARCDEICRAVCELLDSPERPLPPYRQTWASDREREPDQVNVLPQKVVFDNETFDRHTILSLFAYDEIGLLYRIATALAEQRVVLHFAKIDTHLDQIADVFYVSEEDGSKLLSPDRQQEVRDALLHAINERPLESLR
jgi:[protein-PII] uridylyltransferase